MCCLFLCGCVYCVCSCGGVSIAMCCVMLEVDCVLLCLRLWVFDLSLMCVGFVYDVLCGVVRCVCLVF